MWVAGVTDHIVHWMWVAGETLQGRSRVNGDGLLLPDKTRHEGEGVSVLEGQHQKQQAQVWVCWVWKEGLA